jgi:hypothetical protein
MARNKPTHKELEERLAQLERPHESDLPPIEVAKQIENDLMQSEEAVRHSKQLLERTFASLRDAGLFSSSKKEKRA